MPYPIAGIDVHKMMLAVAGADVEGEGDFYVERPKVGTSPIQLRALSDWLVEREVDLDQLAGRGTAAVQSARRAHGRQPALA